MEIMGLLQDDDTDFETIEKVVSRDAALSFKLLKIINSASIAVSRKIESIGQALVLLGQQELKRWLTLLLLTQVNDRCPFELLSTAFIRGLFSEKIANAAGCSGDASSVYFIGLLSLLDSILRCPMEQAVKGLPLSDQLKAALINESGSLGVYIVLVKAYERAQKDKIKKMAGVLGIEVDQVVKCYIESLKESGAYMQGIVPDASAVS
jgi:EAL and modified HD-GYP domain-containing signal transduction protein